MKIDEQREMKNDEEKEGAREELQITREEQIKHNPEFSKLDVVKKRKSLKRCDSSSE